jgi:hypothetical protein
MAESKPSTTMSGDEIHALAERLRARADSILNTMPNQCADMLAAARLIRVLLVKADVGGKDSVTLSD